MPRFSRNVDRREEVLSFLAKEGPANTYQIKKGLEIRYSVAHESVRALKEGRLIKLKGERLGEKGVKTQVYELTFRGFLQYLASLQLPRPPDMSSATESAGEKRAANFVRKRREYLQNVEGLAKVIESQGQGLGYALFAECRGLVEHFGPTVYQDFVSTARLLTTLNPPPIGAAQLAKELRRERKRLEREREFLLRNPGVRTAVFEGSRVIEAAKAQTLADQLAEEIKHLEERRQTLLDLEDRRLREAYAEHFLERLTCYPPAKMSNENLHRFAVSILNAKRERETAILASLERAAALFTD
jgi:hypothetical protein